MNISTIECISESENMEWMIKQLSKSQRDRNLFAIFRLFGSCHLMIEIPLRLESQKITTFFEYEMNISYISIYSESKNMEDCRDRRFPLKRQQVFERQDRELLKTVLCKLLKSVLYIHYLLVHNLFKSFRPCTITSKTAGDSITANRPKSITAWPASVNCCT